jgi:hypothetical protein
MGAACWNRSRRTGEEVRTVGDRPPGWAHDGVLECLVLHRVSGLRDRGGRMGMAADSIPFRPARIRAPAISCRRSAVFRRGRE